MLLSVIIPTRNRAGLLSGVLRSLTLQTFPANLFEVIVIDNGSTDSTREICDSLRGQIAYLSYYYDAAPGLHVGRHLGMKMAKSDILVYADDDIEAFPTWLEGIAESFQDDKTDLVGGKNLPKFEIEPPDWIRQMWEPDKDGNRILGYLSILDLGDEKKEISPFHVFGCNFSIRKSVLLEAGGFHPDAMPQELIKYRGDGESHVSRYIQDKGYKAFYNPKASVYHLVPQSRMTEEYFCRRAFNQAISDSFTDLRMRNGRYGNKQRGFWGFARRLRRAILYLPPATYSRYCFSYYRARSEAERMVARVRYEMAKAYAKGWAFHRAAVRQSNELRDYVLKNSFLNGSQE